ncbi:MAG TPA: hypothetical protein VGV41_21950 [Pseudolabrys sp.]|uniref:hypothetical protein n=1 Tax=Pseudolabrys sp. TaxID=1960880 RepID=UPI002DDD306F|nr:hypothetical protein [Pseudolabrys sp.]HEV2631296.1 hypothetical protein [Pseudolabrys sp.]
MRSVGWCGRVVAAAFGLAFIVSAAAAQQPGRIRGEIVKRDADVLAVKTRDGATLNVKIDAKTRVSALVKASLADIKTDTFIGIAGMPRPDGGIEAFSIHIFLPAQRGVVPDRTGPWDARPGSTMTNAYVESAVTAKDGETLKVKYKDGEKTIVVSPQTAIAAAAKGDASELKSGAQVIIFGWDKQADGSILAKTMYVGRGLTPAM